MCTAPHQTLAAPHGVRRSRDGGIHSSARAGRRAGRHVQLHLLRQQQVQHTIGTVVSCRTEGAIGPTLTLTRYAIVLLETLQSGESLSVTDDGWVSETCAARHAVCRHSTLLRTAESTA